MLQILSLICYTKLEPKSLFTCLIVLSKLRLSEPDYPHISFHKNIDLYCLSETDSGQNIVIHIHKLMNSSVV